MNQDPLFINSVSPAGTDSVFGTSDDGLMIQGCSPAINSGSNAELPLLINTDNAGQPRIFNGTVDIGAYECLLIPSVFTFKGSGNWDNVHNWQCNWVPTSPLIAANEIIIDTSGVDCILNIPYRVGPGGKITIKSGKNLIIQGNFSLNN